MPLLSRRTLTLLLLSVCLPVAAQSMVRDYTARVPLELNSRAAQEAAMEQALQEVYTRASGMPLPQTLRGNGRDWAQHFSMDRDDEGLWLRVAFDPASIDHAVRSSGDPLWGRLDGEAQWVYLEISGLNSGHDYARLIDSLGRDDRVKQSAIERIEGGRLMLRLFTDGGRDTLDQLMTTAGFIAQGGFQSGAALQYRMR